MKKQYNNLNKNYFNYKIKFKILKKLFKVFYCTIEINEKEKEFLNQLKVLENEKTRKFTLS